MRKRTGPALFSADYAPSMGTIRTAATTTFCVWALRFHISFSFFSVIKILKAYSLY